MDLTQLLREKFHHDQFRPGQQEIIETILNGESVLGMLPTELANHCVINCLVI